MAQKILTKWGFYSVLEALGKSNWRQPKKCGQRNFPKVIENMHSFEKKTLTFFQEKAQNVEKVVESLEPLNGVLAEVKRNELLDSRTFEAERQKVMAKQNEVKTRIQVRNTQTTKI